MLSKGEQLLASRLARKVSLDASADSMRVALEQAAFERKQKEARERQGAANEAAKIEAREQERKRKVEEKAQLALKKQNEM